MHAPGGDAAFYRLPQQGRNLVADQTIQHTAGLLSFKQIRVDLARMFQGILHCAGGDFVELDPLDIPGFILDHLRDVPGNGLALTIRVGREIDRISPGRGLLKIMDDFFLALDGLVARREIVFLIHADFLGGQVADMPHAGLHHVFAAQKFLDGLHLGR